MKAVAQEVAAHPKDDLAFHLRCARVRRRSLVLADALAAAIFVARFMPARDITPVSANDDPGRTRDNMRVVQALPASESENTPA